MRVLLSIALLLLAASAEAATTYYVTKASDGATNASNCAIAQTASPVTDHLTTIAAARACVTNGAGDTVDVGNGVWNEHLLINKSGLNASTRYTIRARNRRQAIIRATVTGSGGECSGRDALVAITGGNNFIEVRGFELDANLKCLIVAELDTRPNDQAITNVRFVDVYAHHGRGDTSVASGSGLFVWAYNIDGSGNVLPNPNAAANFELLDSEVAHCGASTECVAVDSTNGLIARNFIHHSGDACVEATHVGLASNLTVRDNRLEDCLGGGIRTSLPGFYYNNTIVRAGGGIKPNDGTAHSAGCIKIDPPNQGGSSNVKNIKIWNNSCFGNYSPSHANAICPLLRVNGGTATSTGNEFRNNIGFGAACGGGQNNTLTSSGAGLAPFTFSNNRCANGGNLGNCPTTDDPQYANASGGNLHLTATTPSTIKNAGFNLGAFFSTDQDGNTRPQGPAWDMGAYEFIDSPPLPPGPPYHRGRIR